MILWMTALVPMICGILIWLSGARHFSADGPRRGILGGVAAGVLLVLWGLAVVATVTAERSALAWGGGLELTLQMVPVVRVLVVMIPLVALPIVLWAAAAEESSGLPRLLGLLIAFTGSMELLVLAADLIVVAIAWELLGLFSWVLIAHHWREKTNVSAANYAFNATRLGGLGLWFAAGATLAAGGNFDFDTLNNVVHTAWASWAAAGILAAAASKSAQLFFAPWLFRAMEGPSSVSALLHSSTMVAAGAWLIMRLHEPLSAVAWFGPTAMVIGLLTAVAGGITAIVQTDAKKLLAASTSAQYGLMFTAVGAGYATAGFVHLVTHAACKALLFLAAGTAIHVSGSHDLHQMHLGRRLPVMAAASWIGALALAAIPPLGAAWSKEKIIAASGHVSPWLAVLAMIAGTLSAWYALRFQTLAYGRDRNDTRENCHLAEHTGIWWLAAGSILLGLLWLMGDSKIVTDLLPGELPKGKTWELVLSLGAAVGAAAGSWMVYRRPVAATANADESLLSDWWGLPAFIEEFVTRPTISLAHACAAFDRRIVDAGVRKAADFADFLSRSVARIFERKLDNRVDDTAEGWLRLAGQFRNRIETAIDLLVDTAAAATGAAAKKSRTTQTGAVPTYLAVLAGGFFFILLTFIFGIR